MRHIETRERYREMILDRIYLSANRDFGYADFSFDLEPVGYNTIRWYPNGGDKWIKIIRIV